MCKYPESTATQSRKSWVLRAPAFLPRGLVNARKRDIQIVFQGGEVALHGGGAGDQHIVEAGKGLLWRQSGSKRAQTSTDAIANDGAANFLGNGIAKTCRGIRACDIMSGARLKNESGRAMAAAVSHPEKFSAFFYGGWCHGAEPCQDYARSLLEREPHRITPTGACGPSHGGVQVRERHQRFASACGSRGDACGRAGLVDKCASRYSSKVRSKKQRPCQPFGSDRERKASRIRRGLYGLEARKSTCSLIAD